MLGWCIQEQKSHHPAPACHAFQPSGPFPHRPVPGPMSGPCEARAPRGPRAHRKDCTCRGTLRLCSRSRHTSLDTCRISFSAFRSCFCSSLDCSAWRGNGSTGPRGRYSEAPEVALSGLEAAGAPVRSGPGSAGRGRFSPSPGLGEGKTRASPPRADHREQPLGWGKGEL